jgi:hypothetical protein
VKVLILGCGPAGLMACHAAAMAGHDVVVVSKRRKSEMYGAQYLHAPIPKIDCGKPRLIEYQLRGTIDGYRYKVYGPDSRRAVSPETLEESHLGWNIRRAYDDLWDMYGSYVVHTEFQMPTDLHRFLESGDASADLVISSLPAPLLCTTTHQFSGEDIWAIGDAPERGVVNPIAVPAETVVCNGEPDVSWYRTANVFGRSTTEWPVRRKPPVEGVARVTKPLATDCTCWPAVRRVGRYGQWTKGVLSHTAYVETAEYLGGQGIQEALF